MNKETFEQRLKKRELIWNVCWISLMVAILFVVGSSLWVNNSSESFEQRILIVTSTTAVCSGLLMAIFSGMEGYFRRNLLKEYWIEDHGDVVKLFGVIRVIHIHRVYREVLAIKKGFKIVEDAYDKYGCTIAAVRANEQELEDKEKLKEMGVTLSHI